jgi:hypothetical protein
MSDDIGRLFERAGREIRPEFRAHLLELLDETDRTADPATSPTDDSVFLVHVDRASSPRRRRWRPGAWLGVAAGLIVLVGLVARRASDDPSTQPSPVTTARPVAECALVAETLGVVATQTNDIRVGIMPDGYSFCLVDDATGAPLVMPDLVNHGSPDTSPPAEPTIVEFGVADTTAYFYVVAIPDGMPVASIRAPGDQVLSFPTRVGRRMLVIDSDFDVRVTPEHATQDLNLYSTAGTVLDTLVVDKAR